MCVERIIFSRLLRRGYTYLCIMLNTEHLADIMHIDWQAIHDQLPDQDGPEGEAKRQVFKPYFTLVKPKSALTHEDDFKVFKECNLERK
jgi:hypothetical protein